MYRVIVASHRSNVRDTVLHLVIINPVAARNTAVRNLDSDRIVRYIRPARLSTRISNLRRVKSVSRLSDGIDSFSKMEIYKILYAYGTIRNVFVY